MSQHSELLLNFLGQLYKQSLPMFHKTAFKTIFSLPNANKKGSSYRELEKNSQEWGKKLFLLHKSCCD